MQASSAHTIEAKLTVAIDAALRPAGMLPDLSRIIGGYARLPVRWDASAGAPKIAGGPVLSALSLDGEQKSARLDESSRFIDWYKLDQWAISEQSIAEMPHPSTSAESTAPADVSSLRVWSIRVDRGTDAVVMGVTTAAPTALEEHGGWGPDSYAITSMSASRYGGASPYGELIQLPFIVDTAAGAVYHFTADLAHGTARVRPVLPKPNAHYDRRREWVIAEGLKDLGACRVYVAMRTEGSACTLLVTEEALATPS